MAVTLDSLKKVIKKNKGRSQALAWLADMERTAGDLEAALKTVDEALAAFPSDVPAMLVRAKILASMQDFAGSVTEYKKVLSKDPFCLSAHKRMGESYDKLGKIAERNACFRRVHDMDPLDPFWKDEYDMLPEEQTELMAPPMDDSSFTMDVDETDEVNPEDDVFANLAASLPNADEEDSSAMDALRSSLATATGENAEQFVDGQDVSFDGHMLNTSEVSSAISDILGGDDDLDDSEYGSESETNDSPFSHMEFPKAADDASLESIDAQVDDAPAEESEGGLFEKSADAEFSLNESDESNAEETNIDDAFSSLLGDDELPEEKLEEQVEGQVEEKSEEKLEDLPEDNLSLDEPALEVAEENVSDSALDSTLESAEISETAEVPESSETLDSLELEPSEPQESEQQSAESQVAEPQAAESVESFGSLFEKSADAEFSLNESPSEAEESLELEPAEKESDDLELEPLESTETELTEPVENEQTEVAETEMEPTEQINEVPQDESAASTSGVIPSTHMDFSDAEDLPSIDDSELSLDKEDELTLEEPAAAPSGVIPTMHMDFSDAEDLLKEEDVLDITPSEEAPAETESSEKKGISEDLSVSVDGAFDALFGDDEKTAATSETVEETPVEENATEEAPAEDVVAETSIEEETPAAVEEAPVEEEVPAAVEDTPAEDNLAKEMGGAFASMFGDEDEPLTEEKKEAPVDEAPSQESTSAEIEENIVTESAPVEKAELEEPSLGQANDSDDDFVLESASDFIARESSEQSNEQPVEQTIVEQVAEEQTSVESVAEQTAEPVAETPVENAPVEEPADVPSAELDSLGSEVSNAFKGLFDEDDSLSEADAPSNKGVDYLMSGDSDDEVSASLVNNAEAPLSRGATDLDDSLNTRTLADIYMEQGVYNKALEIYSDLAKKNPNDAEIKSRLEEVKKLCHEKFGEN